jgi:archaeal type IV pilus assembly protein PilA
MQLLKIEKRKGISPLIATLLLIAIAVAASVLTYSWVMSMIGSQSGQAQTQVRIDGVEFIDSTHILVTVRNTGSIDAQIESVWVRTNTAGSAWDKVAKEPAQPVLVGKAGDVAATLAVTLADNASYVVRVTTSSGFYYESVSTSPVF